MNNSGMSSGGSSGGDEYAMDFKSINENVDGIVTATKKIGEATSSFQQNAEGWQGTDADAFNKGEESFRKDVQTAIDALYKAASNIAEEIANDIAAENETANYMSSLPA